MPSEIIELERRHQGWSSFYVAKVRTPDGHEIKREIEDHGVAAGVLPFDPGRRVATLVRQFRAPPFHAAGIAAVLECPAGMLDGDEPEVGIRREALEEVGLRLQELERVGTLWSLPGISTERIHLFLAAYSPEDRLGTGGGLEDEHEDIEVEELPLADLAAMADDGRLDDMKTLVLVQTLRLRRPELFGV